VTVIPVPAVAVVVVQCEGMPLDAAELVER